VRPGLVAARNEHCLRIGNALQGIGGLQPPYLCGVGFGADDHEIVVHYETARGAIAFGHPGLLGRWRMRQQHAALAASALLQNVPTASNDRLDGKARLLAKRIRDNPQDSAILPLSWSERSIRWVGLSGSRDGTADQSEQDSDDK
jgi:hypothetical protein